MQRYIKKIAKTKLLATFKIYFLIVNSNFKPPSGKLFTRMVPPCSSTAFFTMASPSPVPPIFRLLPLSTR